MSYGTDWSGLDPATARRVHDAYVAGHRVRLENFVRWLEGEGFDSSEMLTFSGFECLDGLWAWLMQRPTLPGHEPYETSMEARFKSSDKTDWWPVLVPPGVPDFRWLQEWWLTDEALELCSGLGAVVSELLISRYGWEWRFAEAALPPRNRNLTVLGHEGHAAEHSIERSIIGEWFRGYQERFGPEGTRSGEPIWHGFNVIVNPELADPIPEAEPWQRITAEWEESGDTENDFFVLDIDLRDDEYLDPVDTDGTDPREEHERRISVLARRLAAHQDFVTVYQGDRYTAHGTVVEGVTLRRVVQVANEVWDAIAAESA